MLNRRNARFVVFPSTDSGWMNSVWVTLEWWCWVNNLLVFMLNSHLKQERRFPACWITKRSVSSEQVKLSVIVWLETRNFRGFLLKCEKFCFFCLKNEPNCELLLLVKMYTVMMTMMILQLLEDIHCSNRGWGSFALMKTFCMLKR